MQNDMPVPLYSWSPLSQGILFVFPSSLFISFPSSNLKDLTEYVFLKEMKSVHSCSDKWKHSTVYQVSARTPHHLENLSLIFLVVSSQDETWWKIDWSLFFLSLNSNAFCTTSLALTIGKNCFRILTWGLPLFPIGS